MFADKKNWPQIGRNHLSEIFRFSIARRQWDVHYDAEINDSRRLKSSWNYYCVTFIFLPNAQLSRVSLLFVFKPDVCCDEPVCTHYALAYTRFIIDCISSLSASSVLYNKQNNKNATVLTAIARPRGSNISVYTVLLNTSWERETGVSTNLTRVKKPRVNRHW